MTSSVEQWVDEVSSFTHPENVVWCDGSESENDRLIDLMVSDGTLIRLNNDKLPNCFLHRSNPQDVARTEHLTFICSENPEDAGPTNNWMAPNEAKEKIRPLFDNAMRGRTMYVVPYLMGPAGSPYAKVGVEITDSPYVVANMRIMTRMGKVALDRIKAGADDWVPGLHSLGDRRCGEGGEQGHMHRAAPPDAQQRDHQLGRFAHQYRDRITGFDTEPGQRRGEAGRLLAQITVGEVARRQIRLHDSERDGIGWVPVTQQVRSISVSRLVTVEQLAQAWLERGSQDRFSLVGSRASSAGTASTDAHEPPPGRHVAGCGRRVRDCVGSQQVASREDRHEHRPTNRNRAASLEQIR